MHFQRTLVFASLVASIGSWTYAEAGFKKYSNKLGYNLTIPDCWEAIRPIAEGSGNNAEESDAVELRPSPKCKGNEELGMHRLIHIYFLDEFKSEAESDERFEMTKDFASGEGMRQKPGFSAVIYSKTSKLADRPAIWMVEQLPGGIIRWWFKLFCPNRLINASYGQLENLSEGQLEKMRRGEVPIFPVAQKITESARCTAKADGSKKNKKKRD